MHRRKSGSGACIRAKPFFQHLIFPSTAIEISVSRHGTKQPREQLGCHTIDVNYSICTETLECNFKRVQCAICSSCAMQSAIQFLESDAILSTMQLREFSAASAELRSRLHRSRSPPNAIKIRPHL